ncbi:MAG: helix-turn-helix domain-containing protein [Verrucomicrobia bacterium]|nr:helix-turn-helix domain-containing protein [Verrucomicrobiota bacterium]
MQLRSEKLTATTRLFLRPDELVPLLGVSKRTLSSWQAKRVLPFRRIGRTILFSLQDVQAALDKFTVQSHTTPKRRASRLPSGTQAE